MVCVMVLQPWNRGRLRWYLVFYCQGASSAGAASFLVKHGVSMRLMCSFSCVHLIVLTHFLARVSFHLHLTLYIEIRSRWFQRFLCSPRTLGKDEPILTSIFLQMGWWKTINNSPTSFSLGPSTGGITLYSFWFSWSLVIALSGYSIEPEVRQEIQ